MVGSFGQIGICFQGGTPKITRLIPGFDVTMVNSLVRAF